MANEELEKELQELKKSLEEIKEAHTELEISHEELQKAHTELSDSVLGQARNITDLGKQVKSIPAAPTDAAKKKGEKFVGIPATNKDKSGDAANEYHFTHDGKNYRFNGKSVAVPPGADHLGGPGQRITAQMAQSDTKLHAILVKQNSGQIKEVL